MLNYSNYLIKPGVKVSLKNYPAEHPGDSADISKSDAKDLLNDNVKKIKDLQDKLYAQNTHSLLIVLQAIDTAGKDGFIRHVFGGVNPAGVNVYPVKVPSEDELAHDFLWRVHKWTPGKGLITIFNRSHYEEVIVVKVHPDYLLNQHLPDVKNVEDADDEFWQSRYDTINDFEKHLTNTGTSIIKFFLNLSKKEQKKRLLDRIEEKDKNWKFSIKDVKERQLWDKYQSVYEDMLSATSTQYAPWYVLPADEKPITRLLGSQIIIDTLEKLQSEYPKSDEKKKQEIAEGRQMLENEN